MLPLTRLLVAAVLAVAASEGAGPSPDIPPPPPNADPGTTGDIPPPPPNADPGTTDEASPAPPNTNPGTATSIPPPPNGDPGTVKGAPDGSGGSATQARANLAEMMNQASLRQNDPRAYEEWMARDAAAYNHVFGSDAFNSLTAFRDNCRTKCSPETWVNSASFFRGAGLLARLEDDASAGHPPKNSAEYASRDDQIKGELRGAIAQVTPRQGDAPEVITSFHQASEPVMNKVLSPREHEDASRRAAEQTNSAPSWNNLGNVLLQNGRTDQARSAYGQAIGRDPSNADAYSGRAKAEFELGNYPQAATDAAAALDFNPRLASARETLLLSERRLPQGSWPELHNDLAKRSVGSGIAALGADIPGESSVAAVGAGAVSRTPSTSAPSGEERQAQAFVAEARKSALVGDAKSALAALDKAVAANPRNAEAYALQAVALTRLRNYQDALAAVEKGLAVAPDNPVLLDAKASVLNRLRDFKGALAAADRAIALRPRDAVARYYRAQALAGLGDRKGMVAALKEAAALDAKFAPAYEASIQLPESSDLLLLFADDKPAAQSWLDGLAGGGPADDDRRLFYGEMLVGFLLVVGVGLTVKRVLAA